MRRVGRVVIQPSRWKQVVIQPDSGWKYIQLDTDRNPSIWGLSMGGGWGSYTCSHPAGIRLESSQILAGTSPAGYEFLKRPTFELESRTGIYPGPGCILLGIQLEIYLGTNQIWIGYPGAARSAQELPWAARNPQKLPGSIRSSQKVTCYPIMDLNN